MPTHKEIAHDKRVQAALSTSGAVLGLSALTTKGGAVAARQTLKRAPKVATRFKLTPRVIEGADKTSLGLVTAGSGVGGASGIKFATLQRKEAKMEDRRRGDVAKDYLGVQHGREPSPAHITALRLAHLDEARHSNSKRPLEHRLNDAQVKAQAHGRFEANLREMREQAAVDRRGAPRQKPLPKQVRVAFKPRPDSQRGGINPERRRQRRMKLEQAGLGVGGTAALAAGGTIQGRKSLKAAKPYPSGVKRQLRQAIADKPNRTAHLKNARADALRGAGKAVRARSKGGLALVAAGAVAGAGAVGMHKLRRGQGRHYADWWDG